MLTMPVDRITILLEQAAEIELPPSDDTAESEAEGESDGLDTALADDPAYRELTDALEGLTLPEVYELLAVAILGESDDAEGAWEQAVQEAQTIPAADALDELASVLVLTDAVEIGLDRLGYTLDEDDEIDSVDDEEEAESIDEGEAET
jgi:hypothetical protein